MRFVRGGRIEVSLTRPVFLRRHFDLPRENRFRRSAARAELQIHVENQRGEQVLTGSAAIRLSDA